MKKAILALVVAAVGFGTTDLAAQTANGAASVTIPTVLVVHTVGDLTIGDSGFDFSATDEASSTGTVSITTRSNIVHAVNVTSTAISDGTSSLTFEVKNSGGTFVSAGTEAVTALASLARGTQTNDIEFQATADVNTNDPGEYTGTITYTVIAN